MSAKLRQGILNTYYTLLKENLYDKISVKMHADCYTGEHGADFAEPEFAGKYLDICTAYYINEADEKALSGARQIIDSIIKAQRADGYLGMYMPGLEFEGFSVWNQAFTLFGMLSYYRIKKEEDVLQSVEKCALYLAEEFKKRDILDAENDGSQNLVLILPMAILYGITGKKEYKDFLESIKNILKNSDINLISPDSILTLRSKKGIELLAAYIGLLEYARMTDDNEIVIGAIRYWEEINSTQVRNTGGATNFEVWTKDGNKPAFLPQYVKPNENCVTVGWIEFSLELFYFTREAKYLDAVEKSLFNHLLGAVSKNYNDFCYYQPNFGKKVQGTAQSMYSCCRYRGLTLFAHMNEFLYYADDNEIIPMIYADSVFENENVKIIQTTKYPESGTIEFDITIKKKSKLKLRKPLWCSESVIYIDGKKAGLDCIDGYYTVDLTGERIHIIYEMEMCVRIEEAQILGADFVSVSYGPILMASDSSMGKNITDIMFNKNKTKFVKAEVSDGIITLVSDDFTLVDYASAGLKNPQTDEFSVWIRRI